jgi:hypothetical protein
MSKSLWILSRLEENPVGERQPGPTANRLAAFAAEEGFEAAVLDPLDAHFVPDGKGILARFEADGRVPPALAVAVLDPFRPAVDLLFLEALRDGHVACRNGLRSLRNFRDALRPFRELAEAGVPFVPVALVRRPQTAERIARDLGLPLELRLPGPEGRTERARFEDLGSLRGALDLLWKEDVPAVAAAAPPADRADRWIPVIGGRCAGREEKVAIRAAQALDIDFGCVRVRGENAAAVVAEVVPYPAAPGQAPDDAVLEEIADRFFEV